MVIRDLPPDIPMLKYGYNTIKKISMNKVRKFYAAALILLGAATLGVIFFAEKSASKGEEKAAAMSGAQSGAAAQESEAGGDAVVSAWQLYENEEGKFRLDCPGDWTVKEDKDEYGNTIAKLISPETSKAQKQEGDDAASGAADVVVTCAASVANEGSNRSSGYAATTLEELLDEKGTGITRLGETDLGGIKATEVIEKGEGDAYAIYAEKDGRVYEISFTYRADKESLSAVEKKILETFKVE